MWDFLKSEQSGDRFDSAISNDELQATGLADIERIRVNDKFQLLIRAEKFH